MPIVRTVILLIALVLTGYPSASLAADWEGVGSKTIQLFYPGQTSWEWLLIPSTHSGAKKFRTGKDCRECHEGEEKDIGDLIVSGEKLEPDPIAGKPGSIPVDIAMMQDNENFYVKFEWMDERSASGSGDFAARVTMMIGDAAIKESVRAGCFGTCHSDVKDMPDSAGLTKYLAASRTKLTRTGGGENYKPDTDIDDLIKDGISMEYWQAKLNPGEPAVAVDGYVMKDRQDNDVTTVKADADYQNGKWSVVLSRSLAGGPKHKTLQTGVTYPVGFAIHSGYAEKRHHYVSLEYTFALDGETADFVASSP